MRQLEIAQGIINVLEDRLGEGSLEIISINTPDLITLGFEDINGLDLNSLYRLAVEFKFGFDVTVKGDIEVYLNTKEVEKGLLLAATNNSGKKIKKKDKGIQKKQNFNGAFPTWARD